MLNLFSLVYPHLVATSASKSQFSLVMAMLQGLFFFITKIADGIAVDMPLCKPVFCGEPVLNCHPKDKHTFGSGSVVTDDSPPRNFGSVRPYLLNIFEGPRAGPGNRHVPPICLFEIICMDPLHPHVVSFLSQIPQASSYSCFVPVDDGQNIPPSTCLGQTELLPSHRSLPASFRSSCPQESSELYAILYLFYS